MTSAWSDDYGAVSACGVKTRAHPAECRAASTAMRQKLPSTRVRQLRDSTFTSHSKHEAPQGLVHPRAHHIHHRTVAEIKADVSISSVYAFPGRPRSTLIKGKATETLVPRHTSVCFGVPHTC